jgi:dTDP-4-amino-4,6-dideoxygalactose transaminase
VGVFSLYATKNVTCGEGGMITTDDAAVAEACRLLRNQGMRRRYYHERLGYNLRLSDLHAAIGLAQLERLAEFTEKRRANAAYLSAHIQTVVVPRAKHGYGHVWHQYTVRVNGRRDRDAAARQLREARIGTGIFYPIPVHQHAYVRDVVGEVNLPVAERLAREVLSLPVHPQLTQADLEEIVAEMNRLPGSASPGGLL